MNSQLRTALYDALVAAVPEVNGRVLQAHMAGPTTEKPFLVVKLGDEFAVGRTWAFEQGVEVWVYVDGSYVTTDQLVEKVVATLHKKAFAGYETEYRRGSSDFNDDEWNAVGRRVDFGVALIRE